MIVSCFYLLDFSPVSLFGSLPLPRYQCLHPSPSSFLHLLRNTPPSMTVVLCLLLTAFLFLCCTTDTSGSNGFAANVIAVSAISLCQLHLENHR